MALPWRRDKTDLRTQVAEYIYAQLNKENPEKSTLDRVKKYNKQRKKSMRLKIVVFIPVWIPAGKQKGHWIKCRDKLVNAFLDKGHYNAGGWTEYKADGYYRMEDKIIKDRHTVIEAIVDSTNIDDISSWLEADIRSLQSDMVQDSIWLVINDVPPADGYSPATVYEKKSWRFDDGDFDAYPDEIIPSPPEPMPRIPINAITNIGQITNIGTQNITNYYSTSESPKTNIETPGDLYRIGLGLFSNDKPIEAYEKFLEAWKSSKERTEPHLIEVCKRSAQEALMCLKGRSGLATEEQIEQLQSTVVRLNRDKEIPDFEGLDGLIKAFSDKTNLLHHEDQLDYLAFIGERIEMINNVKLDPSSVAVSRKQIKNFREDLFKTLEKEFPGIHDQIYRNAISYYRTAKKVITARWQEYMKDQPTLFPDNLRKGSSFSLSSLLEHDQFASIKANLKKNTTWKSTNNLDISRFVEGQSKLFDVMEEPNFRRLDENSLTGEELREDLKSIFRTLSADRDDLIENLSEIIRFCSRTDTKELSDNKNLIAVVFERHGGDKKPWHIISKYEHFKNRIDSLAWGEYIDSTSKAHGKEGSTLDLMKEWLGSRHIVLEIEGIGGLGKTASVLEFIRRLGDFGEKQQYLSHDMFFLTAKSKEQGEKEVDSEAYSRGYELRNPRNYDLGIGEYLKELKFEDVLLRINQLYDDKFNRDHELNEDDLRDRVVSNLRGKKALIFLDNFEDVSEEERTKYAKFFEKLPPGIRVVITTRPGVGDIGPSYKMKLNMLNPKASSDLFELRYLKLQARLDNRITKHLTDIREMKNASLNIIEQLIDKVPSGEEFKEKKDAIRQGSSHPLVIFYMVSMSLNNRPKQIEMGFLDHLLDLSLDPEKGFDKAQRDWQSWVITKSYSALGPHALKILEALAHFGGTADDDDLIDALDMDTDDYNQGVSQLTMQEIFIEQSTEQQGLILLKKALPILKEKGITIKLGFGEASADTTKIRVDGLELLLGELRAGGPSQNLEFDAVDKDLNLNAESRGGVDLSLLGIVVKICSCLQSTIYYGKWNKFLQNSLDYYSEKLKSQAPEKQRYLIDLYVRAAISRVHDQKRFTDTLLQIYRLNRAPGLGERTRDQLRELIEKDDYDFVFDIETYESIDHIRVWLAILDSIMLEISHKKTLQRKLIRFILQLYASPHRLDDLDVKFIKNVLSISRDAIDWNVQYDLLHDLYTDQDEIFKIDDLDDIPRYTRYDPEKIAEEDLESSNVEFRDEFNDEVSPDKLGPNVLLSFDKKDYFSNVYTFRVVANPNFSPPPELEHSEVNPSESDELKNDITGSVHQSADAMEPASSSEAHMLPTLSDWKPDNVITNSNKIKDEDLMKYLINPANWNRNNQISKKVLEGKFGKISRDQIDGIIEYVNSTDESKVQIEIEAKGNPYTERYEMTIPLEHDKGALDKFVVEWFEDVKEGEINYYCRGMPFSVKTVGDLFNGYLPAIRDNVRKTNSQRGIDFANEHLKSLPADGNIGPKTSFVWYCAFHTFRDFINVNDLAELRCKLIPQLAREQHRRLGREELKPTLVNILRARCREWEVELIRIHCSGGNSNPNRSSPSSVNSNSAQRHAPRRLTSQHALKKYDVYNKEERQLLFEAGYAILQENDANFRIQKTWVSLETRKAIFQQRGILSIAEFLNRLANFDRLMKN